MAYIIADKQFGRPILADGTTPNPIWNELVQAATRGLYVQNFSDHLKLDGIKDFEELSIAKVYALAGLGIETHEYPSWIKIPVEDLEDPVPTFLPGAYVLDQYGVPTETLQTWNQWASYYQQSDTHAYIELAHSGSSVLGTVLKQLVDNSYTVLSKPEALAEVAQIGPSV